METPGLECTRKIWSVSFSGCRSRILVCMSDGLWILSTSTFGLLFHLPGEVLLADLVPHSSLVGVVREYDSFSLISALPSPRGGSISDPAVSVGERILAFRMNAKRVLVLTEDKLLIYCLFTLRLLTAVHRGSVAPPSAVLTISETGLAAFVNDAGSVVILDSYTLQNFQAISAHTHQPTAVDFSPCGQWLATASTKGTLVRVFQFDEPNREFKLVEVFRRGRTENAIQSVQFSADSQYVVAAGASDTAHVFKLATASGPLRNNPMLNILPQQYKDAFEAGRDYAFIRLRKPSADTNENNYSVPSACVVRNSSGVILLSGAYAFMYELKSGGGECRIKEEVVLVDCEVVQVEEFSEPMGSVETHGEILGDESFSDNGLSSFRRKKKNKHKVRTTTCATPNVSDIFDDFDD